MCRGAAETRGLSKASTQFTCFTRTKVQILTRLRVERPLLVALFCCFQRPSNRVFLGALESLVLPDVPCSVLPLSVTLSQHLCPLLSRACTRSHPVRQSRDTNACFLVVAASCSC
jgi:hypothetical protein